MLNPQVLVALQLDTERQLLTHVLAHEGFEATPVTPRRLLECARSAAPAGIVLDDGFLHDAEPGLAIELCRALAGTSATVIALGNASSVHQLDLRVDAWIARHGFQVDELLTCLRSTTLVRPAEPAATSSPDVSPACAAIVEREDDACLPAITKAQVRQACMHLEDLAAFEFNLAEALTLPAFAADKASALAQVAGQDPVLALAILAQANRDHGGDDGLVELSAAASVFDTAQAHQLIERLAPLEIDHGSAWDPGSFWAHSVAVARIGAMLAGRMRLDAQARLTLTAGLLHDMGIYVLAHHFPEHFAVLASGDPAALDDEQEVALIGASHGQIGAWLVEHFHLPSVIEEVVRAHDAPPETWQSISSRARMVSVLVQAADRLAHALFTGEPIFSELADIGPLFDAAARHANLSAAEVINDARGIMAELVTKMGFEFPGSTRRPEFHTRKVFDRVTYYAPQTPLIDTVRLFFETRANRVVQIDRLREDLPNDGSPMVVNLSRVNDVGVQVESLTSVMAAGLMTHRRGVVLVPGQVRDLHRKIVDDAWMVLSAPARPGRWLTRLAQPLAVPSKEAVLVA